MVFGFLVLINEREDKRGVRMVESGLMVVQSGSGDVVGRLIKVITRKYLIRGIFTVYLNYLGISITL